MQHLSQVEIVKWQPVVTRASDEANQPLQSARGFKNQTHIDNKIESKKISEQKNEGQKKQKLYKVILLILLFAIANVLIIIYRNRYLKQGDQIAGQQANPSITVVFYGFEDGQYLNHSLQTFTNLNKYQITNFVAIVKDFPSKEVSQKYRNILWIINNEEKQNKWYQKLDLILRNKQYSTDYYFIFDDQWMFIQPGFIDYSLEVLTQFKDVTQVLLFNATIEKAQTHQTQRKGFSFTPGLHRRSDLVILQQAFTNFMEKSQQRLEEKLSQYFIGRAKYAFRAKKVYINPMYSSNRFKVLDSYFNTQYQKRTAKQAGKGNAKG